MPINVQRQERDEFFKRLAYPSLKRGLKNSSKVCEVCDFSSQYPPNKLTDRISDKGLNSYKSDREVTYS